MPGRPVSALYSPRYAGGTVLREESIYITDCYLDHVHLVCCHSFLTCCCRLPSLILSFSRLFILFSKGSKHFPALTDSNCHHYFRTALLPTAGLLPFTSCASKSSSATQHATASTTATPLTRALPMDAGIMPSGLRRSRSGTSAPGIQ